MDLPGDSDVIGIRLVSPKWTKKQAQRHAQCRRLPLGSPKFSQVSNVTCNRYLTMDSKATDSTHIHKIALV